MAGKKWPRPPKSEMLCRICGDMKPESGFSPAIWAGAITRAKCRECYKAYNAQRYPGMAKDMESARRKRLGVVNQIKFSRGCKECGESHPACLDFHHRNKSEKTVAIGSLVCRTTNIQKILTEIEKCDVLCSNCHRKHHWKTKTVGRPRKADSTNLSSANI